MIKGKAMALEIGVKDFPVSIALAVVGGFVGATFQIGYFLGVGTQFISLATLTDWLFTTAALLPILAFSAVPVGILYKKIKDKVDNGTLVQSIPYIIFRGLVLIALLAFLGNL